MLEFLSPQRRRVVFLAGGVVLAAVAVFLISFVATDDVRDDGVVPVVVVPGYGGDASSVDALVAALVGAGREVHTLVFADRGTGAVETSARGLDSFVDNLNVREVDVVGHSAGGVIARYWVRHLDGDDAARRVVTLGSPHHGTTLITDVTAVSPGDCRGACADLRPGSPMLAALNDGDETPDGAEFITVWTSDDETVTPPESAALDGARNIRLQDLCPGRRVSHSRLTRDRVSLAVILGVTNVTPQAPLDCAAA